MKEISKQEMQNLIDGGYIKNTNKGLVNNRGNIVSFYKTRNKRYIEDKYADIAQKLK